MVEAGRTGHLYREVKKRAEQIGMKINNKKTQELCISGSNESFITANVRPAHDEEITSGSQLKVVGFWFGQRPTVALYVKNSCQVLLKIMGITALRVVKTPARGYPLAVQFISKTSA